MRVIPDKQIETPFGGLQTQNNKYDSMAWAIPEKVRHFNGSYNNTALESCSQDSQSGMDRTDPEAF